MHCPELSGFMHKHDYGDSLDVMRAIFHEDFKPLNLLPQLEAILPNERMVGRPLKKAII